MPVHQLNHAVLYVRDAQATADFYRDVFGFEPVEEMTVMDGGAMFLRAPDSTNDHDLGIFTVGANAAASNAGRAGGVGLYHLAWEVDTLGDLRDIAGRLREKGVLGGATDHGTTKSLYGTDPDGLEFEVVWLIPADRLEPADLEARAELRPLDLVAELERFGSDLRGGVGISRHAGPATPQDATPQKENA